jgi:hypothetical protein
MEEDSLNFCERIGFRYDYALSHLSRQVCNLLDSHFSGHMDVCESPAVWPPSSPDLEPLYFFVLWDASKGVLMLRKYKTETTWPIVSQ